MISSNSKLDLKLGYMVVRDAEIRKVHLSEISVLIIESTAVSLTAMLLCELNRRKIKVIFCDECHNPYGELISLHGSHDSSSKIRSQIGWDADSKSRAWMEIVRMKINMQADLVSNFDYDRALMIRSFADELLPGDSTNREGHAVKVYFNSLFGLQFSRKSGNPINSLLNYGYSVLLSAVNREIAGLGYVTELGLFHNNVDNPFNLGSDIMEPLRPIVDSVVLNLPPELNPDTKHALAGILNKTVFIDGKVQYLNNALRIYVKSVTDAVEAGDPSSIKFCYYERQSDEADCLLRSASQDC